MADPRLVSGSEARLGRSGTPEPERRTPNQFLRGNRWPDRGPLKPANRRASQSRKKLRREPVGQPVARGGWANGSGAVPQSRPARWRPVWPARPREATVGNARDDARGLRGSAALTGSNWGLRVLGLSGCGRDLKPEWLVVANISPVCLRRCCVLTAGWPRMNVVGGSFGVGQMCAVGPDSNTLLDSRPKAPSFWSDPATAVSQTSKDRSA
jgi:hypothetical protein